MPPTLVNNEGDNNGETSADDSSATSASPPASASQPCGVSPDLYSELQEFLELLSRQPSQLAEDRLLRELLEAFPQQGRADVINRLPPTYILETIRAWNKRLRNNLRQEIPHEAVLCVGYLVEDTSYLLDQSELDGFIDWAAQEENLDRQDFIDRAYDLGPRPEDASNLVDVLALLIDAFRNPGSGLRPNLKTPEVRDRIQRYIASRSQNRVIGRAGGAPSNMAYILRQLGLRVGVHCSYHRQELADIFPECAMRVVIHDGHKQESPMSQGNTFPKQTHPVGGSLVFAFGQSLTVHPSPPREEIYSSSEGRVIYRFPQYVGRRGWGKMFIKRGNQKEGFVDPGNKVLGADGWPNLPLFGSWRVDGEDFIFEIAGDNVMKEIAAQYDFVILGGLHGFRDELFYIPENSNAMSLIKEGLRHQLQILADEGVTLHTEMGDTRRGVVMETIAEVISGIVKSVSLNDDDMAKITGYENTRFFLKETPKAAEPSFERYRRAEQLAKALDLDELYVHCNDTDLLLVKVKNENLVSGALRRVIRSKMKADIFAKGVVVLGVLQRSTANWRTEAQRLPPIMTMEGFKTLIDFAWDLAQFIFPNDVDSQDALFKKLVYTGYYCPRQPGSYAVMAIPVMWPTKFRKGIDPVGAGDMNSSTVVVF